MKHMEQLVLPELEVKITDVFRITFATAYGMNVPVAVEFEYDRDEDELPQVRQMVVRCAQPFTFEADEMELIAKQGCELTSYLTDQQTDAIEEEIHKRMAAHAADDNDAALVGKAMDVIAERNASGWVKF